MKNIKYVVTIGSSPTNQAWTLSGIFDSYSDGATYLENAGYVVYEGKENPTMPDYVYNSVISYVWIVETQYFPSK